MYGIHLVPLLRMARHGNGSVPADLLAQATGWRNCGGRTFVPAALQPQPPQRRTCGPHILGAALDRVPTPLRAHRASLLGPLPASGPKVRFQSSFLDQHLREQYLDELAQRLRAQDTGCCQNIRRDGKVCGREVPNVKALHLPEGAEVICPDCISSREFLAPWMKESLEKLLTFHRQLGDNHFPHACREHTLPEPKPRPRSREQKQTPSRKLGAAGAMLAGQDTDHHAAQRQEHKRAPEELAQSPAVQALLQRLWRVAFRVEPEPEPHAPTSNHDCGGHSDHYHYAITI